ncbi:thioredoxin family protein [Nonlabens ulvanivorans]|uniref:thioredoxin family protein n=1 Tax=Nonlabens ulvanivorans TaxID=906888 RepID=UPI002943EFC7|nr:thioredoxin family protein [Nonlabens ulvanivorans]WOI22201.1 thioredoxin family protein [Nonlabens ulvanivorans]
MELQQIIKDAADKSISYEQYRAFLEAHTVNGTNSGNEVTEVLAEYTKLNNQRMKRLDKTLKILPENQEFLDFFNKDVYFLIITESWCGDAAQTMPMMNKVAQTAGVDFKVVLRDENLLLMDRFLTNGGRAIAKLILVDKNTGLPVTTWGPRPTKATQLVADEKTAKGALSPEFKQELQNWYNKDKGKDTENDLVEMLKAV